uniref:Uncharacterized protein n=1 Tax=Caenorhabditis japonica TaxID=281687 RepID=A0A8R1ESF9_CAEJA
MRLPSFRAVRVCHAYNLVTSCGRNFPGRLPTRVSPQLDIHIHILPPPPLQPPNHQTTLSRFVLKENNVILILAFQSSAPKVIKPKLFEISRSLALFSNHAHSCVQLLRVV